MDGLCLDCKLWLVTNAVLLEAGIAKSTRVPVFFKTSVFAYAIINLSALAQELFK
jgi:hypothetical protein